MTDKPEQQQPETEGHGYRWGGSSPSEQPETEAHKRREIDEHHTVWERVDQLGCHLQGKTRLAAPAGPGQRDQAVLAGA